MDAPGTLQDFVLNLIYDPAARSAFELDPEATLQHAGLGDITAADVQQVIPLVVDSAPVYGLGGTTGVDDITTGVANLDVAGAVSQLQAITSQIAVVPSQALGDVNYTLGNTVASVNAAVIGVTGDTGVHGSVLSGNSLGISGVDTVGTVGTVAPVGVGGLDAGSDPALDLDSNVVAPVDTTVGDTLGHLAPVTGAGPVGVLDSGLDTVANLPSAIDLGHSGVLDVPGVDAATSSVGSLVKPDLGGTLHDPVHDVHHAVTGTVGEAGHAVGGVLGGVTGHATEQEPAHDVLGDVTGLHF
nr:IniB N-terminal domain-containing protein [uncultured Actinoplanes sp.]